MTDTLVPHLAALPPPGQPGGLPAPALPVGPPAPSPAELARQRENQAKEAKRKAALQALQTQQSLHAQQQPTAQPTPAAGPPPSVDTPPVTQAPSAPAPQENSPTLQQPQYQQPNKGLEYLAAGLGLLFPSSGIGNMATGLGTGLKQNADQAYERSQIQAKDQYAAAQAKTKADFANQQSAYQKSADVATAQNETAKSKYQADLALRASGTNPKTQQPFVYPTAASLLPKGLTPSAEGYANAYRSLAQQAQRNGATDQVKLFTDFANEYDKQAIDAANNARQLVVAMNSQREQDARTNARIGAEFAIHNDTETQENARTDKRLAHEDARGLQSNSAQRARVRDEAVTANQQFYTLYRKATTPVVQKNPDGSIKYERDTKTGQVVMLKAPDGTPVMDPKTGSPMPDPSKAIMIAPISGPQATVLNDVLKKIDRDTDPATTAMWYANKLLQDPTQADIILARGKQANLVRLAQGQQPIPHNYPTIAPPKDPTTQAPPAHNPLTDSGVNVNDPKVKADIAALQAGGHDPYSGDGLQALLTKYVPAGNIITHPTANDNAAPPADTTNDDAEEIQ